MVARVRLRWRRLWAYMLERAGETSTWTGLVLLATASGITLTPDQKELVLVVGLGMVGAMRALLPNHFGGDE